MSRRQAPSPPDPDKAKARARALRRTGNVPELLLWRELRSRRFHGYYFRRQARFGPYFADFYCAEAKVAVEVDGVAHRESSVYDESRDRYFVDNGVRVLRVAARDVRGDLESVLVRVRAALEGRPVE